MMQSLSALAMYIVPGICDVTWNVHRMQEMCIFPFFLNAMLEQMKLIANV